MIATSTSWRRFWQRYHPPFVLKEKPMADAADKADQDIDIIRNANIQAVGQRKLELVRNTGCHYCGAPVPELFCDLDCAADYEREQQIFKKQGRVM